MKADLCREHTEKEIEENGGSKEKLSFREVAVQ